MTDKKLYWWGLAGAYGLHLAILALYIFEIVPLRFHSPDRPLVLHHGGDNVSYFNLAGDLLNGTLRPNKFPIGFPLLLLPFILIIRPANSEDLLPIVATFWGVGIYPVAQWMLARLTARLTGQRRLGLLSVVLWTMLPLIFYGAFRAIGIPDMAETNSVRQTWFQMLSDGPATLFTMILVSVFLLRKGERGEIWWAVILGMLAGFLMLIRYTGILTGLLIGLLLFAQRRWRAATLMAASAFVVFLPQFLYNWRFFSSPLTTGYQVLDTLPRDGLLNLRYLVGGFDAIWTRVGVWFLPALLVAAGIAGLGFAFLWQRNRHAALLIGIWVASYAGFYGSYYYSWTGGLLRFLMPVYPAVIILAVSAAGWLGVQRSRSGASREAHETEAVDG